MIKKKMLYSLRKDLSPLILVLFIWPQSGIRTPMILDTRLRGHDESCQSK